MPIEITNSWCVIMISNDGDTPLIEATMGPYTKAEAHQFCDDYNDEYDGSPYHAIVRPLTRLKISARA